MDNQYSLPEKRNFLEPLTSFRFLAALGVFIWHTHIYGAVLDKYHFGYVGVSFFFVLSGFILTYAYYSKLRSGTKRSAISFYISRVAKLYPIHILTYLLAVPLALQTFNSYFPVHTKLAFIGVSLANLALFQSYIPSNLFGFSFNSVSWSISDEMFFYLLFPLLILIMGALRKRLALGYLFLGWGIVWVCLVILFFGKTSQIEQWAYYVFPPLRLMDFTLGILLGKLYLELVDQSASFTKSLKDRYYLFAEVITIGLVIAAIRFSPRLPQTLQFSLAMLPFWGMLIFVFAWKRGIISKILSLKVLVFLGNASFSFYMIHRLIITYVQALHIDHTAFISLLLSITFSCVTYVFFEEPVRLKAKAYLEQKANLLMALSWHQVINRAKQLIRASELPDFTPAPTPITEPEE